MLLDADAIRLKRFLEVMLLRCLMRGLVRQVLGEIASCFVQGRIIDFVEVK